MTRLGWDVTVVTAGFEPEDDDDDVGDWDKLPEEVVLRLDVLPMVLDDVTGLDLVWRAISSLCSQ